MSNFPVFFHSGSNNTVTNNVFVNGSLPNPGTQILLKQITHAGPPGPGAAFPMHGNALHTNIFLAPPNFTRFYSGDAAAYGGWANVSEPYITSVQHNLYFRPAAPLNTSAQLFFELDWAQWRGKGWDAESLIDTDPGFVDPVGGDFRLRLGAPALGLGFKPLAHPHCPP